MDDNARLLQEFQAFLAQRKGVQAPQRQDFEASIGEFRAWLAATGKGVLTVKNYIGTIRRMRAQGLDPLRLESITVIDWAARHVAPRKPRTQVTTYSAVRAWAKWTGQSAAVESLKGATVRKTPIVLPPKSDVERVRDAMRPSKHEHSAEANDMRRDGAVFDLLWECALRVMEATGLEMPNLYVRGQDGGGFALWTRTDRRSISHIRVLGKGGKERVVPLTPVAARSLTNYVRLHRPEPKEGAPGPHYVFRTAFGRLTPDTFRERLRAYGKSVGVTSVGGKTHNGRRTVITNLIDNGAKPSAIIRITGHNSVVELAPYELLPSSSVEREWLSKR